VFKFLAENIKKYRLEKHISCGDFYGMVCHGDNGNIWF